MPVEVDGGDAYIIINEGGGGGGGVEGGVGVSLVRVGGGGGVGIVGVGVEDRLVSLEPNNDFANQNRDGSTSAPGAIGEGLTLQEASI